MQTVNGAMNAVVIVAGDPELRPEDVTVGMNGIVIVAPTTAEAEHLLNRYMEEDAKRTAHRYTR